MPANNTRRRLTFGLLAAIISSLLIHVPAAKASLPSAAQCPTGYTIIDRPLCVEYASGAAPTDDAPVLYQGIRANNAATFKAMMWNYLTNPSPAPCVTPSCLAYPLTNWALWTQGAAANIINIVLGVPGASLGSVANSITNATARFSEFGSLVDSLDVAGRIHWNEYSAPAWAATPTIHSSSNPDTGDVFFFMGALNSTAVITFYNADMSPAFRIERDCGNFMAWHNPVANSPSFAITLNAGPGGSVNPGDTVILPVSLTNNSSANASVNGTLVAYNQGGSRVTAPCAGSCSPGGTSDLSSSISTGSSHGYNTAAPVVAGWSGAGWYWNTSPLSPNMVSSGNVTFTVPTNAPAGPFNIEVCFSPTDTLGSSTCMAVNYNVVATRSPTVAAQNGDVQSGGHVSANGVCTQSGSTANVAANSGSYGDYLIAATGSISDSPSSNGAGGGATLKLGASGGYAEICRPDLLSAANSYSGTIHDISGNSFNVTDQTGLWRYTGTGVLTITGTITQPVTVVATQSSATVRFDSNVVVSSGITALARNLPSLGVVANGNIQISQAVTQLDAYLFSSAGVIDTCYQANSQCANQLTVNGFLMASAITFGRLGPSGTSGAQLAERIALSPQLYLNPPILFGGIATNVALNSQGEKQPLY